MKYIDIIPLTLLFIPILLIGVQLVLEGLRSRNIRHSLVSTTQNRSLYGEGRDKVIEGITLIIISMIILGIILIMLISKNG